MISIRRNASYIVEKMPRLFWQFLLWLAIFGIMVVVGNLIYVPGSDWVHYFQPRYKINSYPPWILWVLALIPNLPFLSGLTLTILFYTLWRRKANKWHILAAFSAMPLFWTLWLGQIDAIPLLGLALLPWGIPLVLLKPQVAVWYTWAWWRQRSDRWLIFFVGGILIGCTFLIWGFWPGKFTQPDSFQTVYDLSIWRIHWLLGLIVLIGALLETDPDRAMALGALAFPYIQGYSYIVLLPAMTRLSGWILVFVWLTSWAGSLAIFWGDSARLFAILFPISLWGALLWNEHHPSYVRVE